VFMESQEIASCYVNTRQIPFVPLKINLTGVVVTPKALRLLVLWNAIHDYLSTFCKDVCLGWIVYIRITCSSRLVLLLIWWLLLGRHTC
jgi:hypothetical protein